MKQAGDEFALRYYRWAKEDANREIAEDFRFLRSIKGALASTAVNYLSSLSLTDQLELFAALLKRFHPRAVEITGEYLTLRERSLLETKDAAMLQPAFAPQLVTDRLENRPARMNRSRFATLMKRALEETLCQPVEKKPPGGLLKAVIGGWNVYTVVSFGSPSYYLHHIDAEVRKPLIQFVSVLSWLGIAGQTTWDLAREGDEQETASAIAALCSHFLGIVPRLVAGLPTPV